MSGPPGIGKTSTAIMVAKTMGFEVVERNASVKRAKSDVKGMAEFVNTGSLNFSGKRKDKKRKVLIMDEVDGMSAGDRGGAAGIAELIAKSRSPVICICNDAHAKKLAPLKRVCLPLTFMRLVMVLERCSSCFPAIYLPPLPADPKPKPLLVAFALWPPRKDCKSNTMRLLLLPHQWEGTFFRCMP